MSDLVKALGVFFRGVFPSWEILTLAFGIVVFWIVVSLVVYWRENRKKESRYG